MQHEYSSTKSLIFIYSYFIVAQKETVVVPADPETSFAETEMELRQIKGW